MSSLLLCLFYHLICIYWAISFSLVTFFHLTFCHLFGISPSVTVHLFSVLFHLVFSSDPPPSLSFLFEIIFSCHQFLFSVTPPLFSLWCVRLLFLPLSHPPLIYFSCSNYPVVFSTYQPTCWALWLLTSANPSQVQFPLSQRIPWLIYSHLNHFPHLTYTSFPLLPVTAIL